MLATYLISLMVLSSGLIGVCSLLDPEQANNLNLLQQIFPLEIIHFSKFATLLTSLILINTSINLIRKKHRAYLIAFIVSFTSVLIHLLRDIDYIQAAFSLIIAITLFATRKKYFVKSDLPNSSKYLRTPLIMVFVAYIYAVAGFWFLDPKHFGVNFDLINSMQQAASYMLFIGNDDLIPQSIYAKWFIDSLYFISSYSIGLVVITLYKPLTYKFQIRPQEVIYAKAIVKNYGNSSLDYFKTWNDKSFFFSEQKDAFIAYKVKNNFAITLGDPVGKPFAIEEIIKSFAEFCIQSDWEPVFFQVENHYLNLYQEAEFKKIKMGDDALVDLENFDLSKPEFKSFAQIVNKFEKKGYSFVKYIPPLNDEIFASIESISNNWLEIKNHCERYFSLGYFEKDYVRNSEIFAVLDANSKPIAFINPIPDYAESEATIDMMRRYNDTPSNTMDYLFIKTFLEFKARGFKFFSMGLAPMSGFTAQDSPNNSEIVIHKLFSRLNFLFSYTGLRNYKAKYATIWQARYLVFRNFIKLPELGIAIKNLLEKP